MTSFRDKTDQLRQCSKDIKLLIREGYDKKIAYETALKLFGKDRTKFIAIDGTESEDQELDMLVFYAGAFGYIGQIQFENIGKGCVYNEPIEYDGNMSISAAIPLHEQDIASVAGKATEGGIEVEAERIPSALMHLSEYYMAVKAVTADPEIQVVILDRTLAGDIAHLVWSVSDMLESDSCVLQGMDTSRGKVTSFDLELARMLHPNEGLRTPTGRSQLLKYAAIWQLMKKDQISSTSPPPTGSSTPITYIDPIDARISSYDDLLCLVGAKKERLEKLQFDIGKLNERYSMLDDSLAVGLRLKPAAGQYWERVFEASMKLCEHIFNTSEGKHPLIVYNESKEDPEHQQQQIQESTSVQGLAQLHARDSSASSNTTSGDAARWITASDLDYLLLVMLYALLRLAWQRNLLIFGIIKDVSAGELVKTVVPILQAAGKIKLARELPLFSSDKMLLQTTSVINGADTLAPWRTFEFDACFRTIVPLINSATVKGQAATAVTGTFSSGSVPVANVAGAFKNLISAERMFVKSYMQLWCSENDSTVRSHVFSYDRPCYPGFDYPIHPIASGKGETEVKLLHRDGEAIEEIMPVLHFEYDSPISHLIMDILCSMSSEVIPECLGHNYPLFLADKKAKSILEGSKTAYLSTITFEMANSEFDQQVLFGARFRDYRSEIESKRRIVRR